MMNWRSCGEYIDRILRIVGLNTLGEFCTNSSLSSCLLFICFDDCKTSKRDFRIFLEKTVPLNPLAIIIAGKCATDYFDEMLNYLDNRKGKLHIMTGINESLDIDDWKTQFLQGTWPAEERFDSWKEYAVIAIGDKIFQEYIYTAFKEATN